MPNTNPPTWRRAAAAAGTAGVMAFKGLQDWIEVFRAGTHTDSKGRKATFTAEDLDQMTENVSGSGVPFVVGHPKETDPAYAWAKSGDVKREGDVLLVKASDINPAFEAAVDSGAYRERSISIVKDPARGWVLQHVGWLGAVPPAVPGMAPLAYSAADAAHAGEGAEAYQFMDEDGMATSWAIGDLASMLRGLRDWMIAEKGLDVANQVLPDYQITSVAGQAERIRQLALAEPDEPVVAPPAASGGGSGASPMLNPGDPLSAPNPAYSAAAGAATFSQADVQRAADAAAEAARAAEALRFAAQGAELSELRAARQTERIAVQINAWAGAGLVVPAEVPGLAEFMAALEGAAAPAEFSFSAADKSTVKRTPAKWFSDFVAGRKVLVKLGRAPGASASPEGGDGAVPLDTTDYRAINEAAQTYISEQAAKGKTVAIDAAVAHVTRMAAAPAA